MRSENVQRTINQMPKYDKITLHTPDLDGDLTESGYLTYSEGKKPLFSREVRYLSESFPTCYFEDENSSFDKRFITQWFSVINGEF